LGWWGAGIPPARLRPMERNFGQGIFQQRLQHFVKFAVQYPPIAPAA
jgi:hypothetical protein